MLKELDTMKLKDIGEFGLIQRFAPLFKQSIPPGVEGIGNDCAVIPLGEHHSSLVTTDLMVENTHFIKKQISPQDLGYKILAVNLSDIIAMGGKPKYAFLSFALPIDTTLEWIDAFIAGFKELADETGVLLLGGDTTRSELTMVNVTLIGEIETQFIKLRSQASSGDIICCTGYLGDSGGGLKVLLEQLPQDKVAQALVQSHFRPNPQVKEGLWLARQKGVHAMMDISDGLASDILRIMEESHCGAHINVEQLPISPNLKSASQLFGWQPDAMALTSGEDYCLLLTVDPQEFAKLSLSYLKNFHSPLYPIGQIIPSQDLIYTYHKNPYLLVGSGFDHFKEN